MIIADSGVWIDYFNGVINPQTDQLDDVLQNGQVALTDVILMEILQGFRLEKEYRQAKTALAALPCFEILGVDNAQRYAQDYRTLRRQGIIIRKRNDVMIAGFCIRRRIPLLFRDRDFLPFVSYLGLQAAYQAK
ncbi:type II toxin-antitoxin system VapC family toxin [Testudinibacter sp. P80/BLE/0925]|uniref:type II toxin-antitoxin system VapC family toxin n=1 Tax=Testudinibacter sp. TW-1 TaxID=3417757 RepID=UPI003D3608C3